VGRALFRAALHIRVIELDLWRGGLFHFEPIVRCLRLLQPPVPLFPGAYHARISFLQFQTRWPHCGIISTTLELPDDSTAVEIADKSKHLLGGLSVENWQRERFFTYVKSRQLVSFGRFRMFKRFQQICNPRR
jgi:hypothetical protein